MTMHMRKIEAKSLFPDYPSRRRIAPPWIWTLLRWATLAIWIGAALLLILRPRDGLHLLWGVIVPLVPAILVIAPGFWRQICPMAFANQAPRLLGWKAQRPLPALLQKFAFTIAFTIFVVTVAGRQAIFNHVGWATGVLLLASLVAALLGGVFFRARSGWCGTFCPLGPIQRVYGQAPSVVVPQTWCASCVGCQKNCYDLNPEAAVFDDFNDEDPRYSGQRRVFMAMIPGLVLAYFLQGGRFDYSYLVYLALLAGGSLASVGLYYFVVSFLRVDPYRGAVAFAAFALAAFYWFAGPIVADALHDLFDAREAPEVAWALRLIGAATAAGLFIVAIWNQSVYDAAAAEAEAVAKAQGARSGHEIRSPDGVLHAREGQTLLEALQGGGFDLQANCRAGLCGSDAVRIVSGMDNLSPPTADELATLRRFGHGADMRLACSCRVQGPIEIAPASSTVPPRAAATAPGGGLQAARLDLALRRNAARKPPSDDPALRLGIARVVIIGNGVAGATAAQELRKASPSVALTIVSTERDRLYNRMALNKIVAGQCERGDLVMQEDDWNMTLGVDVVLDARAASIDRIAQQIVLEDGRRLDYDRLILATGAQPRAPFPTFLAHRNCFVQRDADDAEALRDCIAARKTQRAVVIGGGVLGVEAAECLAGMGLAVTLLLRGERLMEQQLDLQASTLLKRSLERLGVCVMPNAVIASHEGESDLRALRLASGESVDGDVFLACIGVTPETALARDCGLAVRSGVLVNGLMMTTDPNVFAIGDTAELPDCASGLWPIAVAQARVAAGALLGRGERYEAPAPILRLKSDVIELRCFGDPAAAPGDRVISAPPFSGDWWRIVLRDGAIVAALHVGPAGETSPLWNLVQAGLDPAPFLADLEAGRLDALRAL